MLSAAALTYGAPTKETTELTEKCTIEGCDRPMAVQVLGVCHMHYVRYRKHGTFDLLKPPTSTYGSRYALWMAVKKRFPEGTSWSSFKSFDDSIGKRPSYSHRLVQIDETHPIGPDNFQWKIRATHKKRGGTFDLKNKEDRRAYDQHLSRSRPDRQKSVNLKKAYGITVEIYRDMLLAQDGVCAICRRPERLIKGGKVISLSVDHDHATDAVRGLLCNTCNRALGLFEDNPEMLSSAIAYLAIYAQPLGQNIIPFRKEA